jgi:PadR family transcriptional regulator, regulatory protein PadR
MAEGPRLSADSLKVLGAMLEDPMAWHYGLGLAGAAEVSSGTIYPMLARLENAGWLESRQEDASPESEGRPRRRLYRLTGAGERSASERLEEIERLSRRVKRRRGTRKEPRKRLA